MHVNKINPPPFSCFPEVVYWERAINPHHRDTSLPTGAWLGIDRFENWKVCILDHVSFPAFIESSDVYSGPNGRRVAFPADAPTSTFRQRYKDHPVGQYDRASKNSVVGPYRAPSGTVNGEEVHYWKTGFNHGGRLLNLNWIQWVKAWFGKTKSEAQIGWFAYDLNDRVIGFVPFGELRESTHQTYLSINEHREVVAFPFTSEGFVRLRQLQHSLPENIQFEQAVAC